MVISPLTKFTTNLAVSLASKTKSRCVSNAAVPTSNMCMSSSPIHQQKKVRKSDSFGIIFDIDGVITRGGELLPEAKRAFLKLVDPTTGKFKVPVVFATNAGNCLRQTKAEHLSQMLEVQVHAEQVLMSHSPLRMFTPFHKKKCLISGQGPVSSIAKYLGFENTVAIEDIRETFPWLDRVDHLHRVKKPKSLLSHPSSKFEPIEAILLFGEPVKWETALQLTLDALLTNGHPGRVLDEIPYPHIPVIACNMDLLWMAESDITIPRLAHGSFLLCLESLYYKITGKNLQYTALIGKPSELTYYHAETVIGEEATHLGWNLPVKTLYCVGDNKDSDICGANLYNRYLQFQTRSKGLPMGRDIPNPLLICASAMHSILVRTGVHGAENGRLMMFHGHRDFAIDAKFREPDFEVNNVLEAVELVFERETFDVKAAA